MQAPAGQDAQAVDAARIQQPLFGVANRVTEGAHAIQPDVGGRPVGAGLPVGAGDEAGDVAAGRHQARPLVAIHHHPGVVERGEARIEALPPGLDSVDGEGRFRRVEQGDTVAGPALRSHRRLDRGDLVAGKGRRGRHRGERNEQWLGHDLPRLGRRLQGEIAGPVETQGDLGQRQILEAEGAISGRVHGARVHAERLHAHAAQRRTIGRHHPAGDLARRQRLHVVAVYGPRQRHGDRGGRRT